MKNLTKFRKNIGIIVGVIFVTILITHDRLKDYDSQRYQNPPPKKILALNKLKFEDVAKEYGLSDVLHTLYFPNDIPAVQKYLPFITIQPYVSVVDINNDGYMDLFFLEPSPDKPSRFFLNKEGKAFEEITDKLPVLNKKGKYGASVATWADFNNDGKVDFFTDDTPCYKLFLQTDNLKFKEVKNHPKHCSLPFSLNVFDFNRDGNLDVSIANYFPPEVIDSPKPIFETLVGRAGAFSKGEPNAILLGDGKGNFDVLQTASMLKNDARSTSLGFAYINDDLWPDLFFGNDYTFDEMYLNKDGKDLADVTSKYIPRFYHGFSGMNTDFSDINNDGQLDLYVTNGWGPPSAKAENLLWQKSADGTHFVAKGKELEIFKCGWAWGAKFSDFDLDGDTDLFVTNGRGRGNKAKSFKDSRSINYLRAQIRSMPMGLRKKIFELTENFAPDFANSNFQLYGFERNCLFMREGKKFYDVAEQAGVDDLENGRSIAMADIDNDGKMDMIIGNTDAPIILYKNISATTGNWIGFSLENKHGLPYHGALLTAMRSDKIPLRYELFIGNGGRGMNDPRAHFGLGTNNIQDNTIKVQWPDGKTEEFSNVALNKYNTIKYGTGHTITK